jgi:hypothetical protein
MGDATRLSGGATRRAGAVSKLFRVLVAGGIALAGCATTKSGTNPDKPDDQTAGSQPSSRPAEPGGVRGW